MRRTLSVRPFFQPQLECLETRDLPSSAGLMLPGLVAPLSQLAQQMTTDVQKMNTDFNQLKIDVANAGPIQVALLDPTQTNDYARLGNDLGQIKALNTVITNAAKIDQLVILLGMTDGTFDSTDMLPISQSFNVIKTSLATASSDLALANALANDDPGNG